MTVADVTARERGVVGATRRLLVTEKDSENFYRPVGFLGASESEAGPTYTFDYLRAAVQRAGFRPFLGFSDVSRSYRSDGLFPLFAERIMDPRRPDHPMFLSALDLSGDAAPLEVLARSGGQRVGDGIFLLPVPEVTVDGGTQCIFLVHGMRYIDGAQERAADLEAGDALQLVPDPDNPATSRAVLVAHDDGGRLGYVPDALLGYVESVHDRRLDVVRVNGPEVGVRLRLLVRLTGRADPAAQPFTGSEWATVAEN